MRLIRNSRKRMLMWIILSIVVIVAIAGIVFMNQPSFGRIPRGERLARIERSPNYQNGAFRNLHETPLMTSDKGRLRGLMDFIFKDKSRVTTRYGTDRCENGCEADRPGRRCVGLVWTLILFDSD